MANTNSLALVAASNQYAFNGGSTVCTAINSSGNFTIEAWIKPSGFNADMTIFAIDDSRASHRVLNFGVENFSGKLQLSVSTDGTNYTKVESSDAIEANQWTYVVGEYDYTNSQLKLYRKTRFDSSPSLIKTNSLSGLPFNSGGGFQIGARGYPYSPFDFWDGKIDDVRVWTVVRALSDLSANYLRELAGNESNLEVYFTLDNTYNDATSNNQSVSTSGTPSFSTDVPFTDSTTTSTSTTTTSTSTSTTTTSTSSSTTTSSSSSTTTTTSTSTTTTVTSTSTTTTSTSTTTTSTSTTTTSTSTTTTTSTSTSTTVTIGLLFMVERVK